MAPQAPEEAAHDAVRADGLHERPVVLHRGQPELVDNEGLLPEALGPLGPGQRRQVGRLARKPVPVLVEVRAHDVDVRARQERGTVPARLHHEVPRVDLLDVGRHLERPGGDARDPHLRVEVAVAVVARELVAELPGEDGGVVPVEDAVHGVPAVEHEVEEVPEVRLHLLVIPERPLGLARERAEVVHAADLREGLRGDEGDDEPYVVLVATGDHPVEAAEGLLVVLPAPGDVGRHPVVVGAGHRERERPGGARPEAVQAAQHVARLVVVGEPVAEVREDLRLVRLDVRRVKAEEPEFAAVLDQGVAASRDDRPGLVRGKGERRQEHAGEEAVEGGEVHGCPGLDDGLRVRGEGSKGGSETLRGQRSASGKRHTTRKPRPRV